jgi:hypothetical protein
LPRGGNIDLETLNQLASRTRDTIATVRLFDQVTMTPAADAWWENELYDQLTRERSGLFGELVARAAPQVLRLALLYALLDQQRQIDVVHLRAALAVWNFCEASAQHIFGDMTGNRFADTILPQLRRHAERGMSRSDILRVFGNHNSAAIEYALDLLLSLGKVKRQLLPRDGLGRTPEIWWAV